jgi:hypothetical protein
VERSTVTTRRPRRSRHWRRKKSSRPFVSNVPTTYAARPLVAERSDRRHEPITASGNGRDVLTGLRLAERAAQQRDVLRQAALLDERVRPDQRQQLLLSDHVTAALHQGQQQVHRLGRQRHHLVAAAKQTLAPPDPKRSELEELLRLRHSGFREN